MQFQIHPGREGPLNGSVGADRTRAQVGPVFQVAVQPTSKSSVTQRCCRLRVDTSCRSVINFSAAMIFASANVTSANAGKSVPDALTVNVALHNKLFMVALTGAHDSEAAQLSVPMQRGPTGWFQSLQPGYGPR